MKFAFLCHFLPFSIPRHANICRQEVVGFKNEMWTSEEKSPYLDSLEVATRRSKKMRFRDRPSKPRQSFTRKSRVVVEKSEENEEQPLVIPVQPPLFGILLRQHRNQTLSLAPSGGGDVSSESGTFRLENVKGEYNFTRVGGYHELKKELAQILDFCSSPENYTTYGVRVPRGLILEGPTGNGKTLIAKCLAGEANMNFISCSGAEFNEKYVGVGAARIRELFRFAEKNKPCIVFIDEIDALGRKRSSDTDGGGGERDQTLNQLLVMMDGFSSSGELLVIGATNRVDILDSALLRPGRIDKIIHVPNPDRHTRKEILDIHRRNKPLDTNIKIDYLVRLTNGFNGAQIENLLNEAVLFALREKSLPVSAKILDHMKEKLLIGQTSSAKKNIPIKTLRRIAIHEIGHLVMALESDHYEKPWKVTIDSMNQKNSLGYTIFESDDFEENSIFVREYFQDKLKVFLGGRVAEEVFYGNSISSGALSDLESAFSMAKKMVMEYGMGHDIIYPYFSETYKKRIDEQIHSLILRAYKETQKYIEDNKEFVEKLAEELLRQKTLGAAEIQDFYNRHYHSA